MDGDGATAVLDAPVSAPESTATETPVSENNKIAPKESSQSTAQPTDRTDRRLNPDALRKFLKAQREADPANVEHVQSIERALGELKSWKTVAPTVREARELKQAIDSVGGREKLAELQTYATSMREVDDMLEAGDPRVVDKILETGAKGIAKVLPALLEKLAQTDPQGISAAIRPQVTGFLDSEGLPDAIDAMVAAFNAGKPDDAKAVLAKIVSWAKGMFGDAKPGSDKPPAQAEWEREREQVYQQRFAGDVKSAFDASMSHAEQAIDRELGVQAKEYGLTPEVLGVIRADVWKRIEKERNADPLFKSTIAAKVNERTRKIDPSTADYLKSQVDQRVKDAVRQELRLRYGFIKSKTAAADPNKKADVTSAPAGTVISIDYGKTIAKYGSRQSAEDAIMNGKAVNSAGKPIIKQGKVWKLA